MTEFKLSPPKKPYYLMTVQAGEKYAWCACGNSQTPPFCDGSHKGTGDAPIIYKAEETKDVFFCWCHKTKKQPFCDGSHKAFAEPLKK